jgi:hypothetical protein
VEMERLPKRITYKESRTVNIGDYESIRAELSYSTDVERINEKEQLVTFEYDEGVDISDEKDAFEQTIKKAMTRVRAVLNAREADIRIRTGKFTEHDTGKKGLLLKLIDVKNWYKKQDKFKVEADFIDDFEEGNV